MANDAANQNEPSPPRTGERQSNVQTIAVTVRNGSLILATVLVALNVFFVADFRRNTAMALLTEISPLVLATGAIINVATFLIPSALAILPMLMMMLITQEDSNRLVMLLGVWWVLLLGVGMLTVPREYFGPLISYGWWLPFVTATTLVVVRVVLSSRRSRDWGDYKGRWRDRARRIVRGACDHEANRVVFVVAFLVTLSLVFIPREVPIMDRLGSVWLSSEELKFKDRSPLHGYVIKADAKWTLVLRDSDRRVMIVPSSSVVERKPCILRREWKLGNPILSYPYLKNESDICGFTPG